MTCEVCQGRGSVNLPLHREMAVVDKFDDFSTPLSEGEDYRNYPCPECGKSEKTVPYRRVRCVRVMHEADIAQLGFAIPIQRSLAARFGEYLMKKGYVTFTTDRTTDDKLLERVRFIAEMGAVLPEDAVIAGAPLDESEAEMKISAKLRDQMAGLGVRYRWRPEVDINLDQEKTETFRPVRAKVTARSQRLARESQADRFSGIDFDDDATPLED